MHRKNTQFFIMILMAVGLLAGTVPVLADDSTLPDLPAYTETDQGLPLCAPGVYLVNPVDCLPYGPAAVLTQWARKGLNLPLKPPPGIHPHASYVEIDQKYAKLNIGADTQAMYYPTLEAAVAGQGALHSLPPGNFLYISYTSVSYYDGRPYLQNEKGEWVRASPNPIPTFQGLLFSQPPTTNFGWIVDQAYIRNQPDINAVPVGEPLARETVANVYDQVEAQGTTWYMIGIDQWVDRTKIRVVYPHSNPPEGVDNGRWIEINLEEQTLAVYEDDRLVFATLVATGYEPYYTQPGLFQIYDKLELNTMQGSFADGKTDFYYLENVPWTLYYDGARAIHGAYWRTYFGYEQSHGCVNLSVGDAHWVYEWAQLGDWVYVYDPSGRTPTDPSYYKEGLPAF